MNAALLFDMDGLLLDTERVAMRSFIAVAVEFGLSDPEAFFLSLVGSSSEMTRARLSDVLGQGDDVDRFRDLWGAGFRSEITLEVPLQPGVRAVLNTLGAQDRTMIVVTSTQTQQAREQLGRAELLHLFRDVIGADSVTAHKPDPAPYLLGAQRAGVAPEACDAFEDSDRGVAAAVAAGCRVSQIPDLRPVGKPLPELGQTVFDTLEEAVVAAGYL